MANTTLTADIIAKEALVILENELGVLNTFHRAFEDEYDSTVNGYKKGATISIRRPADFTVRSGATMDLQDVIEGKVTLTVDQQKGIDFSFSSSDLTLKISDLSERVIKPAMSSLINEVTYDCMSTFLPAVYNYVGTPGTDVNSFDDFYRSQERLNEMSVPVDNRYAVLNPTDHARMLGNLTGLYIANDARGAYRQGNLGNIGGADVMMTQVMPAQDYGTADNTTPLTDGNSQEVSYDTAKDTWTQTLVTDGWDASKTLKAGQVFTIAGVYMVNPKTKRSTGVEQNFTVVSDLTTNANSANDTNITISPPIITSGPHQTVTYSGNFDGLAITIIGPAAGSAATKRQNVSYHKNAFALAMVPMEMPQAAYNGSRKSYKGISVRVIPVYDGINDTSKWRLDVLYGRRTIDPRLATRFGGTS
jgi:hypothetical protein